MNNLPTKIFDRLFVAKILTRFYRCPKCNNEYRHEAVQDKSLNKGGK